MQVIKRNGKNEQLSKKKIYDSIVNANSCVDNEQLASFRSSYPRQDPDKLILSIMR